MTTALARVDDLTPDRVALLKRTLCPDLSNDEMELFANVARRAQLDPFARQIYAVKRGGKMNIQTGIDGFRVIASRTGDLDGQEGPLWCGDDGEWKDVWLAKAAPAAAKVTVYRKGCTRGFVGIARTCEYAAGGPMWTRMPATMIAKCAEALALRKAFPQDLSGLYTSEEMEQAGDGDAAEPPKQLPPARASTPKATNVPATATGNTSTASTGGVVAGGHDPAKGDSIDRTAQDAVKGYTGQKLGNPLNDSMAIQVLLARKGWDWPGLIKSLNDKFKATYSLTRTPWGDVAEGHRKSTIDALNKLPDKDSTGDLTRLVGALAKHEGAEPAAVFQRYAVAACLNESCIAPDDLTTKQLVTACASFRTKLAAVEAAGETDGAK